MTVCHISWTDSPSKVRAPITVMPTSMRMRAFSVWAWPALRFFTSLILGRGPRRPKRRMAGSATQASGGGLLRNPYPALADAARHRLQFRMHIELRQDVLHVGAHGVGRHRQGFRDRLVVVSQREFPEYLEFPWRQRRRRSRLILLLQPL